MDSISLALLKPTEKGRIKEITGGCTSTKRLYELGLNKGSEVEVVKNDLGPIILRVAGFKLALGRGLAEKIIVER